jgi:hypothetical protein
MAATSASVNVDATSVALNTAGPTRMVIRNIGDSVAFLGVAGVGNQPLPIYPGEIFRADIGGSDVLYANSPGLTTLAVIAS